jgi:hypothetical protein
MSLTTPLTTLAPVTSLTLVVDEMVRMFEGRPVEGSKVRPDDTRVFLVGAQVVFADSHVAYVHTYADERTAEMVFDLA